MNGSSMHAVIGGPDDSSLSTEELLNLYMEATAQISKVRTLEEGAAPRFRLEAERAISELERKRQNYRFALVRRACESAEALEYLQKLSVFPCDLSPGGGFLKETQDGVPAEQLGTDDEMLAPPTLNAPVHSPSLGLYSLSELTRAATLDGSSLALQAEPVPSSSAVTAPASTSYTDTALIKSENVSGNDIGKVAEKPLPAEEALRSRETIPHVVLLEAVPTSASSTSSTASLRSNTTDQTEASSTDLLSENDKSASAENSQADQASQAIDHLVQSIESNHPTPKLTPDDIQLIAAAISRASIQVEKSKRLVSVVLAQFQEKPKKDAISIISILIMSPTKDHYGTEFDIRSFVLQEIQNTFGHREEILQALASETKVMVRIGNWLRFNQREKNIADSVACLEFIGSLNFTSKQLTEAKMFDVLSSISKKTGILKDKALQIILAAESKQRLQQRSFSVTGYLYESKRKTSVSDQQDAKAAENSKPNHRGVNSSDVKGLLKKGGSTNAKKNVRFKDDSELVRVRFIESRESQASDPHSVEGEHDRARSMDNAEGHMLKQFSEQSSCNINEIDCELPWATPPLIDFSANPNFHKADTSVTLGGELELIVTDDTPDLNIELTSISDNPLEHEGLVTLCRNYEYHDDGTSTLVAGQIEPPNSEPSNNGISKKRDREEDLNYISAITNHQVGLSALYNSQTSEHDALTPSRHGVIGASSFPPLHLDSQQQPLQKIQRPEIPTDLTDQIIEWRRQDVRDKIRSSADTLPPSQFSTVCIYYPNCRYGTSCHYVHLDSRTPLSTNKKPRSRGPRRR